MCVSPATCVCAVSTNAPGTESQISLRRSNSGDVEVVVAVVVLVVAVAERVARITGVEGTTDASGRREIPRYYCSGRLVTAAFSGVGHVFSQLQ